jgi:UTP--glucose-1-phosphate uridylyltransferase
LLEKVAPGKGGEIQLTDGIAGLLRERKIFGYEFFGTHYDVGDKLGLVRATVAYALKREDLREPLRKYLEQVVNEGR